ncbi:MAG: maleylpyruvate isomerase family mycothiol-dependent enzyme [Chloroflexi bacterium]|nr:maleylpyruvate isomerase family mycothiol-dependent enzyme [Chloroflexota bacterium]
MSVSPTTKRFTLDRVDVAELIAGVRREGDRLLEVAAAGDLNTPVPTCPGWELRDLVRHIGGIHRWARQIITTPYTRPLVGDLEVIAGGWPADADLVGWAKSGHDRIVETLEQASPDVAVWSFWPSPSPLAFWARRMAHETAMHRADAEATLIGQIEPYPVDFALDGLEEMLYGFASRRHSRLQSDPPKTFHLHTTDGAGEWVATIGPEGTRVTSGHAKADCAVAGPASDLFLLVWNRRDTSGLQVFGDTSVLDLWRTRMLVRWE